MKKTIKRLIKLAEKWQNFSFIYKGWSNQSYEDGKNNKVWCYFEEGGKHQVTHINELEVAFHTPININGLELKHFKEGVLDKIIKSSSKYLRQLAEEAEKKEIKEKIKTLGNKLSRLERKK